MTSHEESTGPPAYDSDKAALERAGKKEVLKREWGFFAMLMFGSATLSTWEATSAVFVSAYTNGGPASVVYGFIVAVIGTLAIGASFAEMASISPIAGAQYHWTAEHSPPKLRAVLSWAQGWITVLAWQGAITSVCFLCASMTQGLIIFNDPTYVPERWHTTLLMIALGGLAVMGCTVGKALLPLWESLAGSLHVILFFIITVAILITSDKADNRAVWATFVNAGGWPSDGISFCLGFLTPAFALAGIDAIVHMAEETKHAAINIPRAIIGSIIINGVCGFAFIVAILYSIVDVEAVLTNGIATGYPIIEVFHQATRNSSAAVAMMCGPILIFSMAVFGSTASAGRLTWAFARDRGLPMSRFLSVVTNWNKAPTRALLFNYIVLCLLSLINIGSTVALNAMVSLATVALYASYGLPILLFALRRHSKTRSICFGPWRMPEYLGIISNWVAIVFCAFLVIFLPFPPMLPVTALNMNWASVVFVAVMGFAIVSWFVRGKGRFVGPIIEVGIRDGSDGEVDDGEHEHGSVTKYD
ncbi:hypothetical protein EPUS_03868 [Endocarpon pusillum Z07020]|uniref:Choline transport protein n=1 Tax=Endocarpon pusillum (strain Z07020 / HMAS-L-300199) TaxID=1263415 RepID=U1GP25_ENDPU|nr:uncharacterized protein EPUS_03868 [Endocarpon pusillum Z07020]ERF74053.1 hypothetical protein EPUS_03868 [Endocarpon pusillum Z07020]